MICLVGDIGGTNTRFALTDAAGKLGSTQRFRNSDYTDFDALLSAFLHTCEQQPQVAVLAAAGPVAGNHVRLTNLGWELNGAQLERMHDLTRVELMNDFAAQAWATTQLTAEGLYAVGTGRAVAGANRAILGPGTGLGVSGLVATGQGWSVVAGEGGHVALAGVGAAEQELIAAMQPDDARCTAEHLLSGPGLLRIYRYLGGTADTPREVTGSVDTDPVARQAIGLLMSLLGGVAADVALTLGARGGVYLAGGILPRLREQLAASEFRRRFEKPGPMQAYLAAIPTWVITQPDPALHGLAAYAASQLTSRV